MLNIVHFSGSADDILTNATQDTISTLSSKSTLLVHVQLGNHQNSRSFPAELLSIWVSLSM